MIRADLCDSDKFSERVRPASQMWIQNDFNVVTIDHETACAENDVETEPTTVSSELQVSSLSSPSRKLTSRKKYDGHLDGRSVGNAHIDDRIDDQSYLQCDGQAEYQYSNIDESTDSCPGNVEDRPSQNSIFQVFVITSFYNIVSQNPFF